MVKTKNGVSVLKLSVCLVQMAVLYLGVLGGTHVYADGILSKDDLFGDLPESSDASKKSDFGATSEQSIDNSSKAKWHGEIGQRADWNLGSDMSSPHWASVETSATVEGSGRFSDQVKWHIGLRGRLDSVYAFGHHYSDSVNKNQRWGLELRENYLDVSHGNWDTRVGKQNIVWGEMVGMFVADVVSPRDMRRYILPSFDSMRITQWAVRSEYFGESAHAEVIWIPVASYDEIGEAGSDFYPGVVVGSTPVRFQEKLPEHSLRHTNYGARVSLLRNGWDMSAFFYRSMDVSPTFYRQGLNASGEVVYVGKHDRISQFGGTVSKDFSQFVLKGEAVYTEGRQFAVADLTDANGVAHQNTLDAVVGIDYPFNSGDSSLNVQLFQRMFVNASPRLILDQHENGGSLRFQHKIGAKYDLEGLWLSSLNRTDWMFKPKLVVDLGQQWKMEIGAAIFNGPQYGMFGRYDGSDRIYSEIKYRF